MDWLFENLGKLAPVVIFLLYMISSLKGRNTEEEAEDPEAIERARKIQEEIRRKILERQKGSSSPDQGYSGDASSPPVRETPLREEPRRQEPVFDEDEVFETGVPDGEWEPFRPIPPKPREVVETSAPSQIQEDHFEKKRREIANELKRAREMKRAALEKARNAGKSSRRRAPATRESYPASKLRSELKDGLQGTQSLRKAMVLKEVLDRPVGMR